MSPRAVLTEVIQFIPIISFALPFIVAGEVDLAAAGMSFYLAAAVSVVVIGGLAWRKIPQNTITVGAGLWLVLGAVAYAAVPPLQALIAETQAASLFAVILAVGIGFTALSPGGFVGLHGSDASTVRKGSIVLLVAAVVMVGWAAAAQDIRLGGGLPFILLNVIRRVLSRQLSG